MTDFDPVLKRFSTALSTILEEVARLREEVERLKADLKAIEEMRQDCALPDDEKRKKINQLRIDAEGAHRAGDRKWEDGKKESSSWYHREGAALYAEAKQLEATLTDFNSPAEKAKREVCQQVGHATINELEITQATHGTRHVCMYCGKFWHGEPTPKEIK